MTEPRRGLLLALDTSSEHGSVAVGRGREVAAAATLSVHVKQAESLLPAIDDVLRRARVPASELAGVVVSAGPGSFTGVRVAGATAKGLVRVLGVPLFAYSGLHAAAVSSDRDGAVCALFDARRGEVYAACYRLQGSKAVETLMAPHAAGLRDVLPRARDAHAVFVGDGADVHREEIVRAGDTIVTQHCTMAEALLRLAAVHPELGRVSAPTEWQPDYLRASGAERKAAEA